jgi:hypothetical protein
MGRIDRNFVHDFQTAGFHNRLFEIACFAYLESVGFSFDRSFNRPDFMVSRDGHTIAIEVTSANSSDGRESDISLTQLEDLSDEEIFGKVTQEFPLRMTNVLSRKLKRKYHELSHCAEKPLVLFVAPFFEAGAQSYTDQALGPCLYPFEREYLPANAPAPFFTMPGAEHVSAIVYANGFSVSRFFRAATPCGPNEEISGRCWGFACVETSSGDLAYPAYEYELGVDTREEPWRQGLTAFHNPNARIPVGEDLLPASSRFYVQNGVPRRKVFGFHPLTCFMSLWPTPPLGRKDLVNS